MNATEHPPLELARRARDDFFSRPDERAVLGLWVFLMSDALIFALLLATYGVMLHATAGGPTPLQTFRMGRVLIETLTLLTSSAAMSLASLIANDPSARDPLGRLLTGLAVTLGLGVAFLVMEVQDLAQLSRSGAGPGRSGFLSAFFALVPLHGLHVAAGSCWLLVVIAQLLKFGCDAPVRLNLLRLGLFWHFLDLVWIGIFSLVYLPGMVRGVT